jgi:hypothetical protein
VEKQSAKPKQKGQPPIKWGASLPLLFYLLKVIENVEFKNRAEKQKIYNFPRSSIIC